MAQGACSGANDHGQKYLVLNALYHLMAQAFENTNEREWFGAEEIQSKITKMLGYSCWCKPANKKQFVQILLNNSTNVEVESAYDDKGFAIYRLKITEFRKFMAISSQPYFIARKLTNQERKHMKELIKVMRKKIA